uniref:ZAD domain-containing protein n=1 Tax=Aquila chrysaetos chrysaetos TaxID=223781 RepID=A0A663DM04_AQUCH
ITGYCRLCHGKFSSRSLRNAFGKVPVMGENSEKQRRVDQVFFTDFQRLVGVAVRQDPALPQFVCKKCHAQFYKCRSVLRTFIQRVNASPTGHVKSKGKNGAGQAQLGAEGGASCLVDLITSSPQCLHSLVTWTHTHAGSCPSVPSLQSVLSSEYCGIIRAVWGCGDGHDYVMDTDSDCSTVLVDNALSVKREWNKNNAEPANKGTTSVPLNVENEPPQNRDSSHSQLDSTASLQEKALPQPVSPLSSATGQLSGKQVLSATSDERVKDEFSDLSEG